MTRINSIRMALAIVELRNLEVYQMDVKKTFIKGELDEEIHIKQSEDFYTSGQEFFFCKLVKPLYGLKQAPKQ